MVAALATGAVIIPVIGKTVQGLARAGRKSPNATAQTAIGIGNLKTSSRYINFTGCGAIPLKLRFSGFGDGYGLGGVDIRLDRRGGKAPNGPCTVLPLRKAMGG